MQKGWRFYKSCEDVVEGGVDNIAAVVLGLIESGIGWPVPSAGEVNVFWAMGNLATKMAWPSIVDFVVKEISGGVMQVTLNPSPYTSEVLRRQEKTDVSANEAFFNLAARRIFDATNQLTDNQGVLIHNKASFKDAVNFSTMKTLEKGFDTRFRAKPGTLVILQDDHSYISDAKVLVKRELINTMPGLVRPDHNLTLATNYPALIRWLFRQVIDRPHDVELEYCFDLLKRHFGVASITYMVEHRFTDAVRRDVEAMARNVRRTYFGTLSETTYDWNELGRVLQFLQNSVSAELPSVRALGREL
ncbi:hypothetical protein V5799_009094 [Amblyomma americanum]|uniref:Uncharacterized protein n=1 Tax=Amblyomma americanum TaxID=6943 RepID=A0AAQ4FCQ1_AMBAM